MSYLMNTLDFRSAEIVSGDGAWLVDSEGNRWLDWYADTGASSLGYCHPAERAALERMFQEDIPVHSINLYPFKEREIAAKRVCEAAGMDKAFFCNSGTEAVEAAIKLARLYHYRNHNKRTEIWTLENCFHGRTYGAMAASDGPPYHYVGFGPHAPKFHKFHWGDIERISPDAAAVIVTPILGAHDVVPYTKEQLQSMRDYCDKHGIVLIFDEIQCGSGRAGSFLYSQQLGVEADVVTLAKGIALGYPVGICLAKGPIADTFTPGKHFSTFGGSPASCVFVNAMLDYLTPAFLDEVKEKGKYIGDQMLNMGFFKHVTATGMMIAGYSDYDAIEFAKRCEKERLIIGAWRKDPIRVCPVLDIKYWEIDKGLNVMEKVLGGMADDGYHI
jgi:acetylornithine/succinyldiaminopimelate/putrescine aminotransferase